MEVRDENRKEKVSLKKREKIEVLGEDLEKSIKLNPNRIIPKESLKSGESRRIRGVNGEKVKKAVVSRRVGVPSNKKLARPLVESVKTVSTVAAGKAEDGSETMQTAQKVHRDIASIYQKGIEQTAHAARIIAVFAESKDPEKISPQNIRKEIRGKRENQKTQQLVKETKVKISGKKAEERVERRVFLDKKEAEEKKRITDPGNKKLQNALCVHHEAVIQNTMKEITFFQQNKMYVQDNERKEKNARIVGISNPKHAIIKKPIKDKETGEGINPISKNISGIKRLLKKKKIEFYKREARIAYVPVKKTGKILGKTSIKVLGTGANASNPAGWIVLALSGIVGAVIIISFLLCGAIFLGYEGEGQAHDTVPMAKELSPKVEAYRDAVLNEARKYNMAAYINLFLAVMEVESHGNGNDVFQCSESLGIPRNSLPVSKSIAQGVKYLASCIKQAKVKSPSDLDDIRTAVQGYNFGNGYIPWAIKRDGGWTQDNAFEFARIHCNSRKRMGDAYIKRAGPWNYGDQYYADHVMEYYSNGTASSVGDCAKIALKDRMEWLFPEGTPKTSSQMSGYLIQISVPILNKNGKGTTMRLTVHKKLASEIKAVFEDLKKAGICTISSCTAAYNWRSMATNSSKQSYHSYGTVVDWNWSYNPICYPGTSGYRSQPNSKYMASAKVVSIWKAHGFYWGGEWSSYHDYMHFTYTNN